MPSTDLSQAPPRLLGPAYAVTTVGVVALCALVAFEATAVTTVMPTVAEQLGGVGLYALTFAAPLAGGVVGMVVAGGWSDRRGPVTPLAASLLLFSAGLVVCGSAPTMEVLVAGRLLQGLGGGALTVGLYVLVGVIFPAALQPAVFAAFAAAWVLPSLFGPALAALVASTVGWRWVFLGTVGLVALAGGLLLPVLRAQRGSEHRATPFPWRRLAWAVVGAATVVALEVSGSDGGVRIAGAAAAFALGLLALRRLLPPGTLVAAHGLPAVIATRGLMSASFFCAEAYIVFVLQSQWGLSAAVGGLALTGVGITWASASQLQATLRERLSDAAVMTWGGALLLGGTAALLVVVVTQVHPALAVAAYVVAGAGMGFGYPRTSVAVLAASTDDDRGSNSSALSVADSLGAAFALAVAGTAFDAARSGGVDPFPLVFGVAVVLGGLATVAAARTRRTA